MSKEKMYASFLMEENQETIENEVQSESGRKTMYCPRWLDEDAKKSGDGCHRF